MSVAYADAGGCCCTLCGDSFADYTALLEHEVGCSSARFAARCCGLGISQAVAAIFDDRNKVSASAATELHRWPDVLISEHSEPPHADVDADLIAPGLWLGSASAARNEAFLHAAHVRAIVNCAAEARSLPAARRAALGISLYHQAPIDDTDEVDFAEEIAVVVAQVAAAMQRVAGAVAVADASAASTSAASAAAALHRTRTHAPLKVASSSIARLA